MRKKIVLLSIVVLFTASVMPRIQAFQDNDVEEVSGYKLKTKENGSKKLDVNVTIDENGQGGSVSIGTTNNISSIIRYCKSRNNEKCPKKYL